MELWARARSRVCHFDIQDFQIVDWFERDCHVTVRLQDFQHPAPPAGLTAAALSRFCQCVDRCAGR